MNRNIAEIKLMALQVEAKKQDWIDTVVALTNADIPQEIVMRLKDLWDTTKVIGNQVYDVGRIIVSKILEFVKQNPNLAIGMAIGIAIGALTSMIPFIGSLLAPLAMVIGGTIGALEGHRMDKIAKGEIENYKDSSKFVDLITMAKEFWKTIAEIFDALKEYFTK